MTPCDAFTLQPFWVTGRGPVGSDPVSGMEWWCGAPSTGDWCPPTLESLEGEGRILGEGRVSQRCQPMYRAVLYLISSL